ncbi:O-antigen ligase family protein [Niabella ginsenosidivorans]|uniref:O-antigen ligase family protein n=1 Tax=Niabella ginsenosidivorans TaxID=1176587 RepID=UPI001C54C23F|nr:O-antigen ligase family protein [Niabella ginsenosidivorans]
MNNNLVWLSLIWFIISVMELGNPNGGSFQGWMQEIRTSALYPLLIAPLGCLLINTRKKLNYFLILLLLLSFIASLNGIKQIKIGLSPGEQRFLDEGASSTHLLFGKLRVFSFFSDAGQFGASQAQFVVLGIVLAIGLRGTLKKTLLFILGAISFYGLLISGTRGALFALMAGIFCALLLSKNYKVLIIGGIIAIGFIGMLKYTYIGNSNYNIYRLRTALDPEDASLNVRLNNQAKLADYMASRPFGGGLGVIGTWGVKYNADKFLSTIPPDSYWVKVWAMYGIIGFIIFFSFWMYLIGKCCGMIWNVKDQNLRLKLIALISGVVGIFLCSYGNEVMNTMPSLNVIQLSMGTVYIMCLNYRKEQQAS